MLSSIAKISGSDQLELPQTKSRVRWSETISAGKRWERKRRKMQNLNMRLLDKRYAMRISTLCAALILSVMKEITLHLTEFFLLQSVHKMRSLQIKYPPRLSSNHTARHRLNRTYFPKHPSNSTMDSLKWFISSKTSQMGCRAFRWAIIKVIINNSNMELASKIWCLRPMVVYSHQSQEWINNKTNPSLINNR